MGFCIHSGLSNATAREHCDAPGRASGESRRPAAVRRGFALYAALMARLSQHGLRRVLGTSALFSTAYGNVGSSIYYALGLVASYALGLTPVVFVITGVIFYLTAATYAEATAMYPEAGGSSSFARHAFNELWSFFAAWAQMLNYTITIAISAFFVPHYLGGLFWPALRHGPGRHRLRRRRRGRALGRQRRRRQRGRRPEHRARAHRPRHAAAAGGRRHRARASRRTC